MHILRLTLIDIYNTRTYTYVVMCTWRHMERPRWHHPGVGPQHQRSRISWGHRLLPWKLWPVGQNSNSRQVGSVNLFSDRFAHFYNVLSLTFLQHYYSLTRECKIHAIDMFKASIDVFDRILLWLIVIYMYFTSSVNIVLRSYPDVRDNHALTSGYIYSSFIHSAAVT